MKDKRCVFVFLIESTTHFFLVCFSNAIQHGNFTKRCSDVYTRGIIYKRLRLPHKAAAPMQKKSKKPFNSLFALIKLKAALAVSLCPSIFSWEEDLIALQVSRRR